MTDDPRPATVEALTFDDVLLEPGYSEVLPAQVDVRTRLTREIELGLPLVSAARDTVTEAPLAIAMAQHGGLGILHKNLGVAEQASQVQQVKKFEAGMVVQPSAVQSRPSLQSRGVFWQAPPTHASTVQPSPSSQGREPRASRSPPRPPRGRCSAFPPGARRG